MMNDIDRRKAEQEVLREKAREEALMSRLPRGKYYEELQKTRTMRAYEDFRRPAYAYTQLCNDPNYR